MIQEDLEKQEALKKLTEIVKEVKICMFATIGQDHSLYSRPMQTIDVDEQGNLWFFTNEHSGKVDDVTKNYTVYLMYSHPGQNTYLHVKGECTLINDKEKMKELWSPVVKAWFRKV
jgi:general stress protein 26